MATGALIVGIIHTGKEAGEVVTISRNAGTTIRAVDLDSAEATSGEALEPTIGLTKVLHSTSNLPSAKMAKRDGIGWPKTSSMVGTIRNFLSTLSKS